jgi:hypothetical protein
MLFMIDDYTKLGDRYKNILEKEGGSSKEFLNLFGILRRDPVNQRKYVAHTYYHPATGKLFAQ